MEFNYSKLEGKIKEVCDTKYNFANKINISMNSLTNKLNNKKPFKQKEIYKSIEVLQINPEELKQYFFTLKVEKN